LLRRLSTLTHTKTSFLFVSFFATKPFNSRSGSAPSNGVLEVEATSEFYRLWSALLFLYCMRETKSAKDGGMDPVPDDSEFGHGFLLAGAMFIHLLGMRV